jgi:hypothetical protein
MTKAELQAKLDACFDEKQAFSDQVSQLKKDHSDQQALTARAAAHAEKLANELRRVRVAACVLEINKILDLHDCAVISPEKGVWGVIWKDSGDVTQLPAS